MAKHGKRKLVSTHRGTKVNWVFNESLVCTAEDLSKTLTKEELLQQLKQNTISCKDVSFKILGFSLASINSIISLILSVIFLRLFINYGKN